MLWLTSDFHFGHKNISKYAGRPFPRGEAGVAAMNDALVDAFNAQVAADDDVWVLGDVALGRLDDSLAMVARLHGRKVLAAGFAQVLPGSALAGPPARLVLGGHRVLVSHFPYAGGGDSHGEDRFAQHRLPAGEDWLVCGHVHQSWRQRGRMINVGVDAWGGTPVPEAQLAELIEAGPQDRDILPWP